MHPADIKAALEKAGLSQTALAARAKRGNGHVNKSAVCRVINGSLKSSGIAQTIAEAIGLPIRDVFPGKYPALEFIQAAGLSKLTAAQAEADLVKATQRVLLRNPRGVAL